QWRNYPFYQIGLMCALALRKVASCGRNEDLKDNSHECKKSKEQGGSPERDESALASLGCLVEFIETLQERLVPQQMLDQWKLVCEVIRDAKIMVVHCEVSWRLIATMPTGECAFSSRNDITQL
ncbi:MAG: hypothetical protein WKF77_13040, partial [Planctomycetaceae bacterium]